MPLTPLIEGLNTKNALSFLFRAAYKIEVLRSPVVRFVDKSEVAPCKSACRTVLARCRARLQPRAFDGKEAFEAVSKKLFDIVFLDICMPGVDGYQLCAHIRQDLDNKHVKILAISGMSEPQEIKKIMDLGADDYLQKPFSNEALQQKINHILWGQRA